MNVKTCTTCAEVKSLDEFWVSRAGRTKDGFKNECKECAKARRREWASKNREREREWNRAAYLSDPQYYKDQSAKWREENLERARVNGRKAEGTRRARKLSQFVEEVDPLTVYKMHGGMCGICKGFVSQDDFHVDHKVPLSKGGSHGYVNVQPSHPFCNLSKGAKV